MWVKALTSLDQGDLEVLVFECDSADLWMSRARRAVAAGCDGGVSSGLEVERLRREAPRELICVTPGIRPVDNRVEADQKRVMTPAAAIAAGADYLVIGRPIRDRSEEHTSELQSLMRISYAVFCLKKKKNNRTKTTSTHSYID